MRKIILIRHSIPDTYGIKMCIGSGTDPCLSEEGIKLCEIINKKYIGIEFDTIWSSTLKRSIETAELIFPGRSINCEQDFKEIYMGCWDGLSFNEIQKRYPDLYKRRGADPSLLPDGSEKWEDVSLRMRRAILKTKGNVAVISHAGAIKSLILKCENRDFSHIGDSRLDYCDSVTIYENNGILYTEKMISEI